MIDFLQRNAASGVWKGSPNEFDALRTGDLVRMPVNRFSEYPWSSANETIVHEICRASRLVLLDAAFLRMERIGR